MEKTVHLYSSPTCSNCMMAKQYLDEQGINYIVQDITDPETRKFLVAKYNVMTIPVLVYDGNVIVGFNPAMYDELIKTIIMDQTK